MSISHTLSVSVSGNGARTHRGAAISSNREIVIPALAIAASQTDYLVPIAFNYANIQSVLIATDVGFTLETNSGSSPAQTFTFAANGQLFWNAKSPLANPFTANVTAFYVTNTTAITNLNIVILLA